MKSINICSFILIIMSIVFSSCKERSYYYSDQSKELPFFKRGETLYKNGDILNKNLEAINDTLWKKEIMVLEDQIFWTKTEIELLNNVAELKQLGIAINLHGEYHIYWDGKLIGENGDPTNSLNSDKEGAMNAIFQIPSHLATKGKHSLMIRNSIHFYLDYNYYSYFYIKHYDELLVSEFKTTVFIHVFAGMFLMASLYFFFLFLSNRNNYTTLIFSINCLMFCLLIIFEYVRNYISLHYSYHHTRLEIIGIITFLISLLTPLYFAMQFKFPKQKALLTFYALILIFIFFREHENHDSTAYNMVVFMWYTSLAIISYGVIKKMNGAILVLISLLTALYFNRITYYDISIHISFSVILLGMFYIYSVRTKEQRLAYEKSLVQSTRLKLELLKKSIQPHFLMNTLTSLIDWVEEAPDKGVQFIEALADEFDVLNQVENKKLIPISQEIRLCKSHINIMKFRKEIDYVWKDDGIDDNQQQEIPPAVIHTLLENSITHCLPSKDNKMTFKLFISKNKNSLSYIFETHATVRDTNKKVEDGTGYKYVKARLTESYGNNWKFTSNQTEFGWKNTITILK